MLSIFTFLTEHHIADLEGEGDIEQHIAIIRNPKSRRGSFSNFAFPELHPRVGKLTEKL